jgi:hypothetical protein
MGRRPPVERLSPRELQDLFNDHVLPRFLAGELLAVEESRGTPSPGAHQPSGTASLTFTYWEATKEEGLRKVALVHQYQLPDGSIGASGKPDPKIVWHDGRMFALAKRPPPS